MVNGVRLGFECFFRGDNKKVPKVSFHMHFNWLYQGQIPVLVLQTECLFSVCNQG